jgi:hypothetical protein
MPDHSEDPTRKEFLRGFAGRIGEQEGGDVQEEMGGRESWKNFHLDLPPSLEGVMKSGSSARAFLSQAAARAQDPAPVRWLRERRTLRGGARVRRCLSPACA